MTGRARAGKVSDLHQQVACGWVVEKRRRKRNDDIEILWATNRSAEGARNRQRPVENHRVIGANVVRKRGTEAFRIACRGGKVDLNVRNRRGKGGAIKTIGSET